MAKTIFSEDELGGMIKVLIYLYDLHENKINEQYGLGFSVKKIDRTYNVEFAWEGKSVLVAISDHDHEPEYKTEQYEEHFSIRDDQEISVLEQLVSDVLFNVTQTEI